MKNLIVYLNTGGFESFYQRGKDNFQGPYNIIHCSDEKKQRQLQSIERFKQNHKKTFQSSLDKLQSSVFQNKNSFSSLMEACVDCTLEQLTHTLFQIGGAYRRKM